MPRKVPGLHREHIALDVVSAEERHQVIELGHAGARARTMWMHGHDQDRVTLWWRNVRPSGSFLRSVGGGAWRRRIGLQVREPGAEGGQPDGPCDHENPPCTVVRMTLRSPLEKQSTPFIGRLNDFFSPRSGASAQDVAERNELTLQTTLL